MVSKEPKNATLIALLVFAAFAAIIALVLLSKRSAGTPPVRTIAPPAPGESICRNQCGDGMCAEIVCLGSGCPCAESAASCPKDCGAGSPR